MLTLIFILLLSSGVMPEEQRIPKNTEQSIKIKYHEPRFKTLGRKGTNQLNPNAGVRKNTFQVKGKLHPAPNG